MKTFISIVILICIANTVVAQINSIDTTAADTAPHATFYFYRSYIAPLNAPIKKVPIYFNDTLVYSLKANRLIRFNVYREGKFIIAADEKGETGISIKVKFGKEYFFKCEIVKGLWGGKPAIELVTPAIGKSELGMLKTE